VIRVLVAVGFLLLAACTRSPVPITSPAGSQPDDALIGEWEYTLEDDTESIFIRKGDNGELLVAGETVEGGPPAEDFHVIVARIGRLRYVSAYIVAPPGEKPYAASYNLLRYELRDSDHFALYGANDDLLMNAINRKLIAGAPYEDRHLPGIELSANPEELRAFIKAHGARIFTVGPVEFTRVKQQAMPAGTTRLRR
jgi:hypothetical protein